MKHIISIALLSCAALFQAQYSQAEEGSDSQSFITSWNAFSIQFIDAPEFRLLPIPGTAEFRAVIRQGDSEWTITSSKPVLSFREVWDQVETRKFTVSFEWVDASGTVLKEETSERVKAPDFSGFSEPMADWSATADRNMAFLIRESDQNTAAPYREPGVPVWIWAATPHYPIGYPCITINNIVWGFLAHVKNGGPQSAEALRLALATADWGLENRQPDSGALPLFPYSTITKGKFSGSVEGDSVNLLRASSLATAYVDLYAATRHKPYLEYARHIAEITIRFQNADGSFPYRLNPKSGAVVEQYNPSIMEFVNLAGKLDAYGFDARRTLAAQRAVEWARAYVVTTHNWKATYEDISEARFYRNLSQLAAQPLIRYLCRHKDENPAYLPEALRLHRWVEDQFVMFGPDNESSPVRAKGPMVFEQFLCWYPMSGHTANWILTLIELHKATGEQVYLDKAKAAANAICGQQYEDGQHSTFGRDFETGESPQGAEVGNWYNGQAWTNHVLYTFTQYTKGLKE